LQDAGEFVQALVGPAGSPSILDCYRELLSLCSEHHIGRALVVSQERDATSSAAMNEAIAAVARAGLSSQFKLAMVAEAPRTFAVYQSAERLAAENGISARAFRSRAEAVQWLTGHAPGARRTPRA
jgi:hypothetical protein